MKITYEGKCDVCTKPDGERGHNLQKCRVCSVLVHELCYGMVPTAGKDPEFTCHACKSVGREIEVNFPSKVGGWTLRDVLGNGAEGVALFREFLRGEEDRIGRQQQGPRADAAGEHKLDFCIAVQDFVKTNTGSGDGEKPLKKRAQHIFDTHLANDAAKRVTLQAEVLAEIESNLYNIGSGTAAEEATTITPALFNAARQAVHQGLERTKLEKYKRSSIYQRHLTRQRTRMTQTERPTKCVLCSIQNGTHAMHPLYDVDGKDGRQLVLPASGAGFRRQEKRLAWVHTLCAMFICASERTGGLMYGCDGDGNFETTQEEEEEEEEKRGARSAAKAKVIESEDEDDEEDKEEDEPPMKSSAEEEQLKFTKCEAVFQPLMKRLKEVNSSAKDVETILECIDSMVTHVDLLTPHFIRYYQIGLLVKEVKKSVEPAYPEVKARCKGLSAKMKAVYNAKKDDAPEDFEPIKNMRAFGDQEGSGDNNNVDGRNVIRAKAVGTEEQKYTIGTAVSNEPRTGKIINFDPETNLYRILYDDGGSEELNETEISHLLLSYTAFFCIAGPVNGRETKSTLRLKSHREFVCIICKKRDNVSNKCLRIPVQCSAGDRYEFAEFKKHHAKNKKMNQEKSVAKQRGEKHEGCAEPMHVGCARWGSNYARVKNKHLRKCYYFPGKPPAWDGLGYPDPVANCFCRLHAIEVQEGMARPSNGGKGAGKLDAPAAFKRKSVNDDVTSDGPSEQDSEGGSAEKERSSIAQKKKRRIMEESDEESE